ncbi:hypothetical protein, partial [Desulfocucumis palustris]|uniref:hypothetical protein n=1 Tax=Desulfocucumis palustris TaxID=1898651 RepID=UPI0010572C24
GWNLNILQSLVQNPDGSVTYNQGDGFKATFSYDEATQTYKAQAGIYLTLVKNQDNSYTVTRKDNLIYLFDEHGKITAIKDLNNNTITYGYEGDLLTGVTDTAGR